MKSVGFVELRSRRGRRGWKLCLASGELRDEYPRRPLPAQAIHAAQWLASHYSRILLTLAGLNAVCADGYAQLNGDKCVRPETRATAVTRKQAEALCNHNQDVLPTFPTYAYWFGASRCVLTKFYPA